MRRLRTAIAGTGFMGRVHLEALRRVEHVEVAAVVGRSLRAAEMLCGAYGVQTASDSFEEVIRDRGIDAVHICTPNVSHFLLAKEALLAGKHVS